MLMSHKVPERPWEKVWVDCFELDGKSYLVTVDYFSNYLEIDLIENQNSSSIIRKLKAHFVRHGIPVTLVNDNVPYFVSDLFQNFVREWGVEQVTNAPHHSHANGMVESAVKTAKKIIMYWFW